MARKEAVQLQMEINSDEEWQQMLEMHGLTVVDVYCSWSGPCAAMVSMLRTIKMAVGGDMLHYAIANCDKVAALERFRGNCEPTWMFIADGAYVNLMFGANAPQLRRLILSELDLQTAVESGQAKRTVIPWGKLAEEEQKREDVRVEEQQRIEIEKEEEVRAAAARRLANIGWALRNCTIMLYLPYTWDAEEGTLPAHDEVAKELENDLFVRLTLKVDLDPKVACELLYGGLPEDEEPPEELVEALKEGRTIIHYAEALPPAVEEGEEPPPPEDIVRKVASAVYGREAPEEGQPQEIDPESVAARYARSEVVPAMWTPTTITTKCLVLQHFFPQKMERFYQPPVPPHIAVAFEGTRYRELQNALKDNEDAILQFAFFSSADAETAQRVANTYRDFVLTSGKTGQEKLVIQLDTTNKVPLLNMAALGPFYFSLTPEEGIRDCELFFPVKEDTYEDEEEEEEEGEGEGEEEEGEEDEEAILAAAEAAMLGVPLPEPEAADEQEEEPEQEGEEVATEGEIAEEAQPTDGEAVVATGAEGEAAVTEQAPTEPASTEGAVEAAAEPAAAAEVAVEAAAATETEAAAAAVAETEAAVAAAAVGEADMAAAGEAEAPAAPTEEPAPES